MPRLSSGRAVGIGPSIYSNLGEDDSSEMSVLLAIQFRQYIHSREDLLAACAVLLVEGIDGSAPRTTNTGYRVGQLLSGESDWSSQEIREYVDWISSPSVSGWIEKEFARLDELVTEMNPCRRCWEIAIEAEAIPSPRLRPIPASASLRQVLGETGLPIAGGWGYDPDAAVVVDRNYSDGANFNGVAAEYAFVPHRIRLELEQINGNVAWLDCRWKLAAQKTRRDATGRAFDVLNFEVEAIGWRKDATSTSAAAAYLRKVTYNGEFWFEISSFFG